MVAQMEYDLLNQIQELEDGNDQST
jgi:hypothetical protein